MRMGKPDWFRVLVAIAVFVALCFIVFTHEANRFKFTMKGRIVVYEFNIIRAYMNEKGRYTFLTSNGAIEEIKLSCPYRDNVLIVKTDGQERVRVAGEILPLASNPVYKQITIYLKDYDLRGGSWNHGKFGRGDTVEIK